MESSPHNQRPFPSQQLPDESLEDSNLLSRHRQPLTKSAGNIQQGFDHLDVSHRDSKVVTQAQGERPLVSYIVPSQPSRQSLSNLELRRQSIRRQRHNRFSNTHNPIVNSPQYQAYRNRQRQEGNEKDQKWPAVLEEAFLDALILIPQMGRRKFSMEGKPHGRNELISAYLWIAYKQTLRPDEIPDEDMRRARKQVSSHIQVLKGFLKGHPAGEKLFAKNRPINGFEDSFKNDPVLNALQAGRLYNPYVADDSTRRGNQIGTQPLSSLKPMIFWILITQPSKPSDNSRRYAREEDIYQNGALVHKYTGLHSRSQQERGILADISNWDEKFPYLPQNISTNESNYPIIHMDVSLVLMDAPIGSDLVTRMEMGIPSSVYGKHRWQAITTLSRPQELYCENKGEDGPLNRSALIVETLEANQNQTRIKVPFPANTWAHVLTRLMKIQNSYEESRKDGFSGSSRRARDYIDQIYMYQEVQSARVCTECCQGEVVSRVRSSRCICHSQEYNFETRFILLWTFNKARRGDQGSTTWRYIDPLPNRRTLMSPPPHPSHHISASMSEHFSSWAEAPQIQPHSISDHFGQGLATPPHTAGLQSPFVQGYGYTPNNFDVSQQDMSFLSQNETVDSEPTIIEHENTPTIDSFLSNSAVGLGNFDQQSHPWNLPHTQSFESDPTWAYHVPTSTSQVGWGNETKSHVWSAAHPSKGHSWPGPESSHVKQGWTNDGHGRSEHLWNSGLSIPTLEQKLGSWTGTHGQEDVGKGLVGFPGDVGSQLELLGSGTHIGRLGAAGTGNRVRTESKDRGWNMEESFGYEGMGESMK